MAKFLVALAFIALTVAGWALETRSKGAELYVNEAKIHTFATPLGGLNPVQRATSAAALLKSFVQGTSFSKVQSGQNWLVKMGTKTVIIVSPEEARAKNVSAQTLSATITQRLIDSVLLAPLVVDKTSLLLPPGKSDVVKLTGSLGSRATVTVSDQAVAKVERTPGLLSFRGLKAGVAKVVIQSGEERIELSVSVLPYAINPSTAFSAEVFGRPAGSHVVAGAAATALQARAETPESVKVWAKVLDAMPIEPGQTKSVKVRVKASGPGHFPYEGDVFVKVTNRGGHLDKEDELWYSNDPENVLRPGQLYWAKLDIGRSARLLFHHKNGYANPLVVRYLLANPSDAPAVVRVMMGEGKPDKNPTRAGYVAGDSFLSQWLSGSAEIVTIPPRSVIPVSVRRLAPEQTCSGLATLGLVKGGPEGVVLYADAVLPGFTAEEWADAESVNGAWHCARPRPLDKMRVKLDGISQEVFPNPFRVATMDYEAGGRFGFARIGELPLVDTTNQKTLAGNFGVVYEISGTLRNPTSAPVEVELLFEASAGYGSGLFVVNGDTIRLGLINPKQEIVLTSIKLPPGSSKPLRIQTIPLSGANYPVTLIVRPTGFELKAAVGR